MTTHASDQRWLAWQSVDTGRMAVVGTASIAFVVGVALIARQNHPFQYPYLAVAFGLFIAFGELLRLSLPGGREAAPIAMVAGLAYAMVVHVASSNVAKPTLTHHAAKSALTHHLASGAEALSTPPPQQVIVVMALGMALGALPHVAAGRRVGIPAMSRRLLAVTCVSLIFYPLVTRNTGHWILAARWRAIALIALLAGLAWLIDTLIAGVIRADDLKAIWSVTLIDEMRVQWRLGLVVAVSAIITVFGAEAMGLVELAVFAGPLLMIQLAFRRYAGIRATYLQTVRALAQVTEVGGYVDSGHSYRVSRLAVAVGRELGLAESVLLNLEYAALMHDIGQLSLADPIPGGATVLVTQAEARRIAEFGAAVIKQTGVLDPVAEIVRCQWLPASGGEFEPPLESKIIRTANAYDDLVGDSKDRDRMAIALERLRSTHGAHVDYDPGIVAALATVTSRLPVSRL